MRAVLTGFSLGFLVALQVGPMTLFLIRLGAESADEVASPRRTFLTALGGTASNPLTIASWAAIFAAANTAGAVARRTPGEVLLVLGVTAGSLAWGAALSVAVGLLRERVGDRALRSIERLAGRGMLGFGGALGHATLRHE